MNTQIHTETHVHTYTPHMLWWADTLHTHSQMSVCMWVCLCVHVCMHASTHTYTPYTHTLHTQTHTHTHTHTHNNILLNSLVGYFDVLKSFFEIILCQDDKRVYTNWVLGRWYHCTSEGSKYFKIFSGGISSCITLYSDI